MSLDAPLAHPAVGAYLLDLDRALTILGPAPAAELREQITAHLQDALGPDCSDDEVAATLAALGTPDDLVREAAPERPATRRRRLPRISWKAWVVAALVLSGIGTAVGYTIALVSSPSLTFAGGSGWVFPQDGPRAVVTQADGRSEWAAPIRSGHEQGFFVTLENPSGWSQTILGWTPDAPAPGGPVVSISVGDSTNIEHGGGDSTGARFSLPATIPPGGIRLLRVIWVSTACLSPGTRQGIDQISLQVRVGWFTRTEVIPLNQELSLMGPSQPPPTGRCR
jgi:hypothetical protein